MLYYGLIVTFFKNSIKYSNQKEIEIMSNKTFAKLLSIILSIAICATAVLGCLITVNAQNGPSYVVSETQLVKGATNGSVDATFTIASGMAAGFFTVDNPNNWYTAVTASVKNATPVEGVYSADDFVIEISKESSDARVSFETAGEKLYSTVVLTLNFTLANGIEDDIAVTLSDLDFSDLYANYSDFNATNGKLLAGCSHKYTVSGTPVYTDDENKYAVYSDAVCELCGESKGGYQVKPVVAAPVVSVYSDAAKATTMSGSGTENDPYIVETADQFAAMARGYIVTDGKYFKVADGVDAFVLNGGAEIMNMTTAEQVRDYFRANGGNIWWMPNSESVSEFFRGHFDGNGVTIYGLYTGSTAKGNVQGRAALFPKVAGSVTIKNINLKNSYVESTMHAAGIVAQGSEAGLITIENCSVEDCYIRSNRQNSDHRAYGGVLLASTVQTLHAYNCSVVDNIATYIYDETELMPVISASANSSTVNGTTYKSDVKNIIVIGSSVCGQGWSLFCISDGQFKNVYTDSNLADLKAKNSGNTDTNLAKFNVRSIAKEDLYGAKAMQTIKSLADSASATGTDNFDWNTESNPNGIWYVGKAGDYPTLLKGYELSAANNTAADWNLLGANIEYKNDGSYALNFHFIPAYENQDIELYVAKANTKDGFIKLDTYTTSPFASEYAGAKMFTINTLSARDIETNWLATTITKAADGSEIVYGKTESISIAQIANAVVNGDAYYNSNATDAQKAADVNVASALINYNAAVKDISNNTAEYVVSEYSGNPGLAEPMTGSGIQADPYIVRTADQFAAMARGYIVTEGLYFKVADDVDAFYLSGGATVANMTNAQEVKKYLIEKDSRVWWQPTSSSVSEYFKGHFDGNGITIYGLYTGSSENGNAQGDSALFPKVSGSVSIKNVNLKNSYVEGMYASGLIAHGTNAGLITMENCSVEDCYIKCTRDNNDYRSFGGVLIANTAQTAHVYNCIVVDNVAGYVRNNTTELMPVITASANSSTDNGATVKSDVKNIIAIGASVCGQGWSLFCIGDGQFKNVYTDSDLADLKAKNTGNTDTTLAKYNVRSVNKEDLYGIKAMQTIKSLADSASGAGTDDFDWENVWCYGAEGQAPILVSNKSEPVVQKITSSYGGYDDDFIVHAEQEGNGTKENPYIIYDAGDLASVCANRITTTLGGEKGSIDTTGMYFKVADNISAFYMNGGETVANLTSAQQVKEYFEAKGGSVWWSYKQFNGHFDGNGATVYGVYSSKTQQDNGGLFQSVGTSAVIENINVKNSYFAATSGNAGGKTVGGIVATTTTNAGTLTIKNCSVENCYLLSQNTETNSCYNSVGTIVGNAYWGPTITIENCLAVGNIAQNSVDVTPGLIGFTGSAPTIKNTISIGTAPYTISTYKLNDFKKFCNVASYTNVYTDYDLTAAETAYGIDYADSNIKTLTTAQMQGEAAQTNMPALAWNSIWYVGKAGKYPSFTPAPKMDDAIQSMYDSLVIDTLDNYGQSTSDFGVYSTGLTLKTNPYMTFTFAFNGEYKRNANVVVTFKYNGNVIATTTAAEMTNNEGAGRYHLYRLKNVPVKALCSGIEVVASYNGTTYNLGTYSVEGFALQAQRANRIDPCEYYESIYEVSKALLFYSQMLKERYGA